MIGYDIGARIDLDHASSGPAAGVDAQLSQIQNVIDRVDASMGAIPEMVAGITGNATNLAAALNGAAEALDRMQDDHGGSMGSDSDAVSLAGLSQFAPGSSDDGGTGIRYGQSGARASLGDAGEVAPDLNHGETASAMSAIFSAQNAGEIIADSAGGAASPAFDRQTQRSEPGNDNVSLPDIVAAVGDVPHLRKNDQSREQFDAMLRAAGEFGGQGDGNSDCRMNTSPLERFHDWYMDAGAGADENMASERVLSDTAHVGRDLLPLNDATTQAAPAYEKNGWVSNADPFGIGQILSEDGGRALDDGIEAASLYPYAGEFNLDGRAKKNDADGVLQAALYRPFDFEPDAGGLWNSVPQDGRMAHSFGQQSQAGNYANDGRRLDFPAGWNMADKTTGEEHTARDAEFWEMLENAQRILPKRGHSGVDGKSDAEGDVIGGGGSGSSGSFARIPVTEISQGIDEGVSNMPVENNMPVGGRGAPTGHRNDPIYTIAINPAMGTLMPMVPTPGTSTRSPPLPGQRNLA